MLGRLMAAVILAALLASLLPSFAAAQKTPPDSSGLTLYAKRCANCHGWVEKSMLSNRSASRIRSAIRQLPAMYGLKDLTDAEIEAIAAILATPSFR